MLYPLSYEGKGGQQTSGRSARIPRRTGEVPGLDGELRALSG